MNHRERFLATMRYQPCDRVPLMDLGFWSETLDAWRAQGLPSWVNSTNTDQYFGMDGFSRFLVTPEATDGHALVQRGAVLPPGLRVGLTPLFDEQVIEDQGDTEVVQQGDGIRVRRSKTMGSIPSDAGHLLTDRHAWRTQYRPRLDSTHPDRYPPDWDAFIHATTDPARDFPLILYGGSLYGYLRNWLGLEAVSCVLYDDPAWFEEMVETVADCAYAVIERALVAGARFEACFLWEDMCYNKGPLISPAHVRQFLTPHYRRLTDLLRRHGIDIIIVDSDGRVDELLPVWLDAGVNGIAPIEIGTTGADPLRFRREYGRDLLMFGGVDKRILADSPAAIDAELARLTPLIENGGFIPAPDHKVPPDVPLAHYQHYVATLRRVCATIA
jgi:uroporphyrinogen decarboxylase